MMHPTILARRIFARYKLATAKRMRIFDFDDTLVSSKGIVSVVKADGEKLEMDSATFAHYRPNTGDKLDFGMFNHVLQPRIIRKNFDELKSAVERGDRVTILTARAKGSQSSVQKFLESQGVKGVEVVGLASSDPYSKARWVDKAIEEGGYDDVAFYDDSKANADAVREYGEKRGITFASHNTPHPHEDDYAGPVIQKTFESSDPTAAVVEYKPKGEAPEAGKPSGTSDWWGNQTDAFKTNYCKEHEQSKYCP